MVVSVARKLSVWAEVQLPVGNATDVTTGGDLGKTKRQDQRYTFRISHADELILRQ